MTYALLLNDVVEEIVDEKYPVNEKLVWVTLKPADSVAVGYLYDGERFNLPPVKEEPKQEPNPMHVLIDAIVQYCLGKIDREALAKVRDITELIVEAKDA